MHFTADTVIVITGSSRGVGLEFVKHFLEYTDSKVVATARSLSKADILRTLITQYAKRLQTVALDTSEESSIEVTHAHAGQTQLGIYASVGLDDCKATVDLHAVFQYYDGVMKLAHGAQLEHLNKAQASANGDTSTDLQASVKEISALHSGIDLLINNAGIEEGVGPIWET